MFRRCVEAAPPATWQLAAGFEEIDTVPPGAKKAYRVLYVT